jgi:chromatin assembly factor 1 subunit B
VINGKEIQKLKEHNHYVQGVAWDPLGTLIASQSSDRTLKIYTNQAKKTKKKDDEFSLLYTVAKRDFIENSNPTPDENINTSNIPTTPTQITKHKMFSDDTITSYVTKKITVYLCRFFRRLNWTVDGSLLLVPAALYQQSNSATVQNTTYVFTRKSLGKPVAHLPGPAKPTVCVRCNPMMFEKKSTGMVCNVIGI